ncbi:hypothetical protein FB561_2229 [Kribbella amoyensis]|uniref:Uncharacterized protein n=1 Tax=Kribbella amoyensis TaxID=996641 RepID=A0A561BQG5_9ACTN|nr:hypothetical protein [Kribbella amoyensis]TWD81125.1 hypothetical protein FB561_2229 [Kribbella amoyensis]
MVVLGIVLIILAVLFGLGVAVSSGDSTTMSVFGVDFGLVVPTLFFLGAAAGIALTLGLWLTKKGLGRGYRRHKEMKELRQQAAATRTPDDTEAPATDAATDPDTAPATDTTPDDGRQAVAGRESAGELGTGPIDPDSPSSAPAAETEAGRGTPGRHAAQPDQVDPPTADRPGGDHLAGGRHTVADSTESRQPH